MSFRVAKRKFRRKRLRPPWWLLAGLLLIAPLVLLNWAVSYFGKTRVFPLSIFFIPEKAGALAKYGKHHLLFLAREQPALAPVVASAGARYRLPPGLLEAVVQVESGFDPYRISPAGAMGPGQLMASTAQGLGVDDPFDVVKSMDGSARYLAANLKRFKKITLAVAAYNAGPGAVTSGRIPRNGETEYYVKKVMREYQRRRQQIRRKKKVAVH